MDIQKTVTELVKKLAADKTLTEKFKKDPVGTVKSLISAAGVTDDQIKAVAEAVKAKISVDDAKNILGTLGSMLGK